MKKRDWMEAIVAGGILVVVFAVTIGTWLVKSHYEARTYERLTGVEVTMWDAMWVELRVTEPAQREE